MNRPTASDEPRGTIARVAVLLGILGVWWGVIYTAFGGGDLGLFELPEYAHPMLGSILPGAAAIMLGFVDLARRGRRELPLTAFAIGIASIAAPFVTALAVSMIIVALIVAAIAS